MRVALVMPLAEQRGGAELMLLHLLRGSRASASVTYSVVFLEHGPMVKEVRALGYVTEVIPADRLRHPIGFARAVIALSRHLRRSEVGLVLSWMPKAHLYVGPAALLAGVPSAWFQHTITSGNVVHRLATALPTRVVLCCSEAALRAQRTLWPVRPITVVYPSVDLERFAPAVVPKRDEARLKLGLPPDRPVVGMVARLQRWKGVHVLIEAIAHVRQAHPQVLCIIVGGPHFSERGYAQHLREQAVQAGVEEHVLFVGHQSNVPEWVQAFDVLVHASTSPEPFGMTILEGMALEKPVVATRAGGVTEIIREGEGVLVPPGDPAVLADALVELLASEPLRQALGAAARRRAADFGTSRLAEALHAALRPIVS